jgi:phosphinothricin acetyltransferase
MNATFIPLAEEHRTGFIDILNWYSENSFAAYPETSQPYERFDFFLENAKNYPAYAALDGGGDVVGFFHLRAYNPLPTFRETAELTIFFRRDSVGLGLGTRALDLLEKEARKRDIKNIVSSVTSRNEPSLAFHRKSGFTEVGRLRNVGKKFGEYFDVVLLQKVIA